MRRVLITGGSGFVGTNAVEYYAQLGVPVLNLDVNPPADRNHQSLWRESDILDATSLRSVISDFSPTEIIHLAACTHIGKANRPEDYRVNTVGVANLIHAVEQASTVRVVFFASTMLLADGGTESALEPALPPGTAYGRSKLEGERLVRASELRQWIIGRLTSIWGPWFGEPYRPFFEYVRKGVYVSPGRQSATKTFGYVENTIRQIDCLLLAESAGVHCQTFYLGDDPPLNIAEWADDIAAELGITQPWKVPIGVLRIAAMLGDALRVFGIQAPMSTFRLKNMTTNNILDVTPIRSIAGEPRIALHEGIERTVRWLRLVHRNRAA